MVETGFTYLRNMLVNIEYVHEGNYFPNTFDRKLRLESLFLIRGFTRACLEQTCPALKGL